MVTDGLTMLVVKLLLLMKMSCIDVIFESFFCRSQYLINHFQSGQDGHGRSRRGWQPLPRCWRRPACGPASTTKSRTCLTAKIMLQLRIKLWARIRVWAAPPQNLLCFVKMFMTIDRDQKLSKYYHIYVRAGLLQKCEGTVAMSRSKAVLKQRSPVLSLW